MIINKVILGFVTQRFDTETRRFVSQEFHGSDDRVWENQMGETLDLSNAKVAEQVYGLGGVDEPYLNMEMIQPNPKLSDFSLGDRVFVTPSTDGSDPQNEFQGSVIGFKGGLYVQVRDQDDNTFDCDPDQLQIVKWGLIYQNILVIYLYDYCMYWRRVVLYPSSDSLRHPFVHRASGGFQAVQVV